MSDSIQRRGDHVIVLACGTRGAQLHAHEHAFLTCRGTARSLVEAFIITVSAWLTGDVQPLSLLAQRLHGESPVLRIDFVTHSAHQVSVSEMAGRSLYAILIPFLRRKY